MTWWTKIGDKVEKHKTQLVAAIHLNFARNMSGVEMSALGLYKRDPLKYPDEPDRLPAIMAKVEAKKMAEQFKSMTRRRR